MDEFLEKMVALVTQDGRFIVVSQTGEEEREGETTGSRDCRQHFSLMFLSRSPFRLSRLFAPTHTHSRILSYSSLPAHFLVSTAAQTVPAFSLVRFPFASSLYRSASKRSSRSALGATANRTQHTYEHSPSPRAQFLRTTPPLPPQGLMKGFDQSTNLILSQCHERIFSLQDGVETVELGLYIVRGDNV